MLGARTWSIALVACGLLGSAADAVAQPAGLDPNRDCQTIRACRYERGGVFRGCVSTYSCRVCRFVRSRCTIDGQQRVCQRMQCTWG